MTGTSHAGKETNTRSQLLPRIGSYGNFLLLRSRNRQIFQLTEIVSLILGQVPIDGIKDLDPATG